MDKKRPLTFEGATWYKRTENGSSQMTPVFTDRGKLMLAVSGLYDRGIIKNADGSGVITLLPKGQKTAWCLTFDHEQVKALRQLGKVPETFAVQGTMAVIRDTIDAAARQARDTRPQLTR